MRTKAAAALCAAVASTLMALGASTATARNLSVSNQNFRWTFNNLEEIHAGVTDTCRVTLEGSLNARTIAKVEGSLVGRITRAINGQCRVATTLLTETLPWHVRYIAFTGRLPNITLLIVRFRMNWRISFCLAEEDVLAAFSLNPNNGSVDSLEVPIFRNEEVRLRGVFCPEPRIVAFGNPASQPGRVALLGTTTMITVTLI